MFFIILDGLLRMPTPWGRQKWRDPTWYTNKKRHGKWPSRNSWWTPIKIAFWIFPYSFLYVYQRVYDVMGNQDIMGNQHAIGIGCWETSSLSGQDWSTKHCHSCSWKRASKLHQRRVTRDWLTGTYWDTTKHHVLNRLNGDAAWGVWAKTI